RWLREPRNAVWIALGGLVAIGGGRRLRQWWQAREAVERLSAESVAPETIRAAAAHGRAALFELFRILGTAETEAQRTAAGQALAAIWRRDDLITEEEKALVRRGFAVTWRARRRYPRALQAPIPVGVDYGVPFLQRDTDGVSPENLEWSHRIVGARRADLETFSPWLPGPGHAEFTLYPGDFETNGPHRLVLEAKVRTVGLTGTWELELPHVQFSFEFDPRLAVEALLAAPDSARGEQFARSILLEPEEALAYVNLNDTFALRSPPSLTVTTPLPFDLAHTVEAEIEGVPGRIAASVLVLSGQGTNEAARTRRFPLALEAPLRAGTLERPGAHRLRLVLTADPHRGWADPDVRSLWPERITTDWVDVEVMRR
ncbi:MAG: hypothetical protein P4L84_29885, partial [Isosphaeraceae bacterium]|nr:hypothetical protein [Isosphaeraceae bacterium]